MSWSMVSCGKNNKERGEGGVTSRMPAELSDLSTNVGRSDSADQVSNPKEKSLVIKLREAACKQDTKEIENLYDEEKSEIFNLEVLMNCLKLNSYKGFDCYIKVLYSKLEQEAFSKFMWIMINELPKKEIINIIDKSKCFKDYLDQNMIEDLFVYTLNSYVKGRKIITQHLMQIKEKEIDGSDIVMLVSSLGEIKIDDSVRNEGRLDVIKDTIFKKMYDKNNAIKSVVDRSILVNDFKDCENVHNNLIKHSKDYADFVKDIEQNGKIGNYSNIKTIRDKVKKSFDKAKSNKTIVDSNEFSKIEDTLDEIANKVSKSSDNTAIIKSAVDAIAQYLLRAMQKRNINNQVNINMQDEYLEIMKTCSDDIVENTDQCIGFILKNQDPEEVIKNCKNLVNNTKVIFGIIDISKKNLDTWCSGASTFEKKCLQEEVGNLKTVLVGVYDRYHKLRCLLRLLAGK